MQKYDLKGLAPGRRAGTKVLLPTIEPTLNAERAYLKALRTMLRGLHDLVKEEVLPVVEREATMRDAQLQDVDASVFDRIRQLGAAYARIANGAIGRILRLEGQQHTKGFLAKAKRALRIDLAAVVRNEDLEDALETIAARNAGLITNLSEATISRIQQTVTNSVLTGTPVKELRKRLTEDFGFADTRARLIARDQTAKFNADMNRIRQQQAGITSYVWRTSRDERVRTRHKELEGMTYEYGKPTGAEQGLPPGMPVHCRCIAQAIIEF